MDFFKKAAANFGGSGADSQSDLLKKAQGFLSETQQSGTPASAAHASSDEPSSEKSVETPVSEDPATTAEKKGYGEVYSSAQTLYDGLQDKLAGKTDVDDHKIAVAAEDVLKAAETSGYLGEDNQYGDYLKKAESFLHNYGVDKSVDKTEAAPVASKKAEDEPAP